MSIETTLTLFPEILKRLWKESPLRQGQVLKLHPGQASIIDIPSPVSYHGISNSDRRHVESYEISAQVHSHYLFKREEIVDILVEKLIKAEKDYFYKILFGSNEILFVPDKKVQQTKALFEGLRRDVAVIPESYKDCAAPLYPKTICLVRNDYELMVTGNIVVLWEVVGIAIQHSEWHRNIPFVVK